MWKYFQFLSFHWTTLKETSFVLVFIVSSVLIHCFHAFEINVQRGLLSSLLCESIIWKLHFIHPHKAIRLNQRKIWIYCLQSDVGWMFSTHNKTTCDSLSFIVLFFLGHFKFFGQNLKNFLFIYVFLFFSCSGVSWQIQILRFSSINPSCVLKCFNSSKIKTCSLVQMW